VQGFEASADQLALQLGASALLVLLMIVIHSAGLIEASRRLHLREEELKDRRFDYKAVALMASLGLLLFALHLLEILIFAAGRRDGGGHRFILIGWSTAFMVSTVNRLRG